LRSMVNGHLNYYAVPGNGDAVCSFRYEVSRIWHRALSRRSQRRYLNWQRMGRIARRWLPTAKRRHPLPVSIHGWQLA